MIDTLMMRDNAKAELEKITDIESGVDYLNKVKAVEVWAKAEKKDAELQNIIAEQKIRTQRILGKLLRDAEYTGRGGDRKSSAAQELDSLSTLGINKKQSSTFQQIAEIPEETFEDFIKEKKEAVNNAVAELTTTGAVKLAKSLKEKKEDLKRTTDINARLDTERELRNLANDIKKKYDRDQIELLIKFLTK
jgi:hypothetical protein